MADSLVKPAQAVEIGELVELVDHEGRSYGFGLYNPNSRIAVRRYGSRDGESLDEAFFAGKLSRACNLRDAPYFADRNQALRLVFSEGDELSGLIVDRFGDYAVMQQTSGALGQFIPMLSKQLADRYQLRGVVHLIDVSTAKLEGIEAKREWLVGSPPSEPVEIVENELRWSIDLQSGQKTGYYHDQRDNRAAAVRWMPNQGRILDVCCYVGGFALNIAKAYPETEIIGIDTSEKVVEVATGHARLNNISNARFEVGDFLKSLEARLEAGESYDGIVVDPPKLAGSRDNVERALRAYHRLNSLAVRLLKPGGILVTCSCSGRVTRDDFWNMLHGVAKQTRRPIQILEQRGSAPDHPILASCPETDYLKCFICRVV